MWNIARRILLLLVVGLLFSCGGSDDAFVGDGGNGTGDNGTGGTGTITLSMVKVSDGTTTNVIRKDSPARITAKVLDAQGSPVTGTVVTFSTSLGILSPSSSVLTDGSGNATVTLEAGTAVGADTLTAGATVNSQTISNSLGYQISAPDVRIGSFSSGTFAEGTLTVAVNPLSAGGTTAVTANLVDSAGNPINFPVTVTFTSNFTGQNAATLSSPVIATAGVATSTYTSTGTLSGTDTITATVDGSNLTATASVNVQGVPAGSITFVNANPTNIALKGMGGIETSVVTFQVKDELGNPKANETVNFILNTTVGGLTLTPTSASSNESGYVSTTVQAGTVGTPVRVTARLASNSNIATQSEQLMVSTGIPDQDSFSLSVKTFNPEAFKIDGVKVPVTVHAADRFNNPVPDGTSIYFTTESGGIEPGCSTSNGACTVNWTSQGDRPVDGRATVTAVAIGEESFLDNNGNGVFDDADTFSDLPEAFQDWNENGVKDLSEPINDFNFNGTYDVGDGAYNGLLCKDTTRCSPTSQTLHVRASGVIVMSTSDAHIVVSPNPISVPVKGSVGITVQVWDLNGNTMPAGTTIAITSSIGTLAGTTNWKVASTADPGPTVINVLLQGGDTDGSGALMVKVTTPGGTITEHAPVPVTVTPPVSP